MNVERNKLPEEKPIKKDEEYYEQKQEEFSKLYLDHIKVETSEQLKQEIDKVVNPIIEWQNSPKTKQYHEDFWQKGETHKEDKEYEKESSDFYNASAEAIVKALVLASNYVYHVMGSSGFQASWADIQYLALRRFSKFGLIILEADDLLYPHLQDKFDKWKKETLENPDVIEYLKGKLEESLIKHNAAPEVQLYWRETIQAFENKQWLKDRQAEYDAKLKKWREENPDWDKWGRYVKPAGQNTEETKTVEDKTEDE